MSEKYSIVSDMPRSVKSRILDVLARQDSSCSTFVPADFQSLGGRAAVDQALSRLVKAGTLRRVRRGVYDTPKRHPKLGPLSPSLPQVAVAIARSTGSRLQISGAHAANQLGLSPQVPARVTYLTDGTTRTIRVGNSAIEFRHASPRTLVGAGTAAGVVIQAFRHLGRRSLTPDVINHVRRVLHDDDRKIVGAHVSKAPAWMQPALRGVSGGAYALAD
jgi:hypothetical protein